MTALPWSEVFREHGQDSAIQAQPDYASEAMAWIGSLPRGQRFTADDVAAAIGNPPSRGVSGAAIGAASKQGLIMGNGYVTSRRIGNRGRVLCQWVRT